VRGLEVYTQSEIVPNIETMYRRPVDRIYYGPAAPVPQLAPVPDLNVCLKEVMEAVEAVAAKCSAELR